MSYGTFSVEFFVFPEKFGKKYQPLFVVIKMLISSLSLGTFLPINVNFSQVKAEKYFK